MQAAQLHQQGDLPETDIAEHRPRVARKPIQNLTFAGRESPISEHPPDPDVRVEDRRLRHCKASTSASAMTGATASPTNSPRPRSDSQGFVSPAKLGGTGHKAVSRGTGAGPARALSPSRRLAPAASCGKGRWLRRGFSQPAPGASPGACRNGQPFVSVRPSTPWLRQRSLCLAAPCHRTARRPCRLATRPRRRSGRRLHTPAAVGQSGP
jgi:hypothetical protein